MNIDERNIMGVSALKRRIVASIVGVVAVMGTTLLGVAPAQAATTVPLAATSNAPSAVAASVTPDFACPTPAVCVFDGQNGTGAHGTIPTSDNGRWVNMTQLTGIALPWQSFHDRSGSSVVFGDAQTGQRSPCFTPGSEFNVPSSIGEDRYVWIEFGNTGCTGTVGPLP